MSESPQTPSAQSVAFLRWFRVIVIIGILGWLTATVYNNTINPEAKNPFKFGLDLAGGSHLVYEADIAGVEASEVPQLMNVLREVIERRINVFGVSEPIVQVEHGSFVSDQAIERLVVELPGVTDVEAAVAEIGRTPLLEFKLYSEELAQQKATMESLNSLAEGSSTSKATIGNVKINGEEIPDTPIGEPFVDTGLTGRYLETASVQFSNGQAGQISNQPLVAVKFTEEGAELFGKITKEHTGESLGIFLDGELLSAPNINEPITGGTAVISGDFSIEEAQELAKNLSFGALPVPIKLQSVQTIGATLGSEMLDDGIKAGVVGLLLIIVFMAFWYRLPGLIAGFALVSYVVIMLALFQWIPVTLTAAGLAGFVLSLGMAVDANVLVFERFKEEFRDGKGSRLAAEEGFSRAWTAIRDGNVTGLLSAIILFWFGTAMIKGFALVLGIGIIISMLSALVLTRTFLMAFPDVKKADGGVWVFLFGTGLKK